MGFKKQTSPTPATPESPKLVRRSANRHSALKTGRTLSAKRERLETSFERAEAHQRLKRQQHTRLFVTLLGFAIITTLVVSLGVLLSQSGDAPTVANSVTTAQAVAYKPTIEVIDEDTGTSGAITGRMSEYIGQAEVDLREYGLIPVKAVIPSGAIREVDFYLDGHPGFIKMILDRNTAVSAEDASRMIRYLEEQQGITDYQYIDVRLPGRAYWK